VLHLHATYHIKQARWGCILLLSADNADLNLHQSEEQGDSHVAAGVDVAQVAPGEDHESCKQARIDQTRSPASRPSPCLVHAAQVMSACAITS